MESHEPGVSRHYTHGNLQKEIRLALQSMGVDLEHLTIDALAPVDEFHIGGRAATHRLASLLQILPHHKVLDLGCGIGGPARYMSKTYEIEVTGIDLTQEFVDTGNALNEWTHLAEKITLIQGSILDIPFEPSSFDHCYMIHVGMNIQDKSRLFEEVFTVLKPGGSFGIYDIMHSGMGTVDYPVPWANAPEYSFLASPSEYKSLLGEGGFQILHQEERSLFAKEFFEAQQQKTPTPLGLHTLIGPNMKVQFRNMISAIFADAIAPVEIIAQKPL